MSMIGTVLRFDQSRGFGFVAPADGSPDVFVHEKESGLAGEPLMKGDKISFDGKYNEKKGQTVAINCQIVEYSASRPRNSYGCMSQCSAMSTVASMQHQHSPMMMALSPAMGMEQQQFGLSPRPSFNLLSPTEFEQQQCPFSMSPRPSMLSLPSQSSFMGQQQFLQQQQQQQHHFVEQPQLAPMMDQQYFMMSPTTITTVFVDEVNMLQ